MGQGYAVVGLPDSAVRESLHRTESAIKNMGFHMPRTKVVVNLAPADIRKSGSALDLPIALGILGASEQLDHAEKLNEFVVMGELSLDGTVNGIKGVLPIAIQAQKEGFRGLFSVVAGALKQFAAATVTQLILGQLGLIAATNPLALLAIPIITAGVNAAVGALLNPILSGLTSFSTGGRVDTPTMAIVGDASNSRAGADSEWIFRDDQIQLMLGMVANKFYLGIDRLYNDIKSDNFRLYDLIKESTNLSNFAINEQGQIVEMQNELMRQTILQAIGANTAQQDVKVMQLIEYDTKKQQLNKSADIDFNSLRSELRTLKSNLLGNNLSENVININNEFNNDNIIATIEIANQRVVTEIQTTNRKLDTLTSTVSNLQLSISQNDIYKANKNVEINRLSRART
jgi:hypothetical protein